MTEKEWSKLCRNIYEKKCILMIGSEFPVECNDRSTTIFELLFDKLAAEVVQFPTLPQNYDKNFEHKDLCQLARDYILYNSNNRLISRSDDKRRCQFMQCNDALPLGAGFCSLYEGTSGY